MSKYSLSIPVLLIKKSNKKFVVSCPYLKTRFDLDYNTLKSTSVQTGHSDLPIAMNSIKARLFEQLQRKYRENGYLNKPKPSSAYNNIKFEGEGVWCAFDFNIEIKRGGCEKGLPVILMGSAIVTQLLALVSAAVSIYVKGVSAPLTLILSGSTALMSIVDYAESGATGMGSDFGRYLDHKPIKRCKKNCSTLRYKGVWAVVSLSFLSIWGIALISSVVSTGSQTEIIDKEGFNKGLTFLNKDVTFFHAMFSSIFTGITIGTFSGHFAIKACKSLANRIIAKCCGKKKTVESVDETSPLRNNIVDI